MTQGDIPEQPSPAGDGPDPRDVTRLAELPTTYQALDLYFRSLGEANPFDLRAETMRRVEKITGRPLIVYAARTSNVPQNVPASIEDGDLTGVSDLVDTVEGERVDFYIESNGGNAEAAERIVNLLRARFSDVRFIIPSNAYSAATLLAFSGNQLVMDEIGTLGPIDPQINGVPARAIIRSLEWLEERLAKEGAKALAAYVPMLSRYELHTLEICKSAQALSEELACTWLGRYMLGVPADDPRVKSIVEFFASFDLHKSHGRSINRGRAKELGLMVADVESIGGLRPLVRSLHNQYMLFWDRTPFFKVFENAHGISWGRQFQQQTIQLPLQVVPPMQPPPPGQPQPSG